MEQPVTVEQTVTAEEGRMLAQVVGDGPRIVLIGGGLTGWKSWEPHADRLSESHTVARLQLLNVQLGLEDRPLPEGYGVRTESAALTAALNHLEWVDPVDLVAWSYGGLVALDFALDHPERVRTLTLIEPPATWVLPDRGRNDPDLRTLLEFDDAPARDVTEDDLEQFIRSVGLAPPGTDPRQLPQWPVWVEHRRSLRHVSGPFEHQNDPARLRVFEHPVLLVTGTGTAPFFRQVHDRLASELPDVRTAVLPGGHAPHLVAMERFLEHLARFLEGGR